MNHLGDLVRVSFERQIRKIKGQQMSLVLRVSSCHVGLPFSVPPPVDNLFDSPGWFLCYPLSFVKARTESGTIIIYYS